MKCPSCSYVCADSRDQCPKCRVDLRSHKRALGIRSPPQARPVSATQARSPIVKEAPRAAQKPTSPGQEAFTTLKTTFAREKPLAPAAPTRPSPTKPEAAVPTRPKRPTAAPSGLDGALNDALAAFGLDEIPASTPQSQTPVQVRIPPPPARPTVLPAELQPLFDEASGVLAQLPHTDIIELATYDLTSSEHRDDIAVLWSMAHQSLDNPSLHFIDDVSVSHLRTIKTASLEVALRRAEKFHDVQKQVQRATKISGTVTAAWSQRTRAAFYDGLVTLGLALPASVIVTAWCSPTVKLDIISLSGLTPTEVVEITCAYLVLICLGSVLTPLVSTLFFSQSVGMRVAGLILTKPDGQTPDLMELLYRACLTPLAMLTAPFDGPSDRLPLHDRHSGLALKPLKS